MTEGVNEDHLEAIVDAQPNSNNNITIDLTADDSDDYNDSKDDEEPSVKKIVIFNNGASTSRNYTAVNAGASTSAQELNHKKPFNCDLCVDVLQKNVPVDLSCDHRFCYQCFITHLKTNRNTSNHCPICNREIDDNIIRCSLSPVDYIYYLEHFRDNLRNALKKKVQNGSSQESPGSDTQSELHRLYDLSYVKNSLPFECPICMVDIKIGDGVMLKNCLHSFCKDCIEETVKHSEDPQVPCPFNDEHGSCEFHLEEREIRALVSEETLEKHLERSFKRAETSLENVFHCKTPDCSGFIQHADDSRAFLCPVCNVVNCLSCKNIHDGMTCHDYKLTFKNDKKSQHELKMTEAAVKKMLADDKVTTEKITKFNKLTFSIFRQFSVLDAVLSFKKTLAVTTFCACPASSEYVISLKGRDIHWKRLSMVSRSQLMDVIAKAMEKLSVILSVMTVTKIREVCTLTVHKTRQNHK